MKKNISLLLSASALLLMAGCVTEDEPEMWQMPITLTTSVGDNGDLTRAGTAVQNTQFAQGEIFTAYFPSNVTVQTTTFKTSDANGNTACTGTQPYFNAGASSATVHAYYPSTVTNTSSSFSVETNQNSDASYKASDLMYATTTIAKEGTSSTGSLTFTHKLSKIVVSATAGAGVTKITDVRIIGGYRTINISTPQSCTLGTTLSNANTASDYITMYSGGNAASADCAAIIPPQTISGNFLEIVTDKGTATYSLDSKEFSSGYTYTLNIQVAAVSIGQTTTIKDWTTSTSCSITVKTKRAAASSFTKASSATVGKIVGADGELYDNVSDALNNGTDAIGIVAYVSGSHGLILALQDAAPYGLYWLYYLKWTYSSDAVTSAVDYDYDVPTLTNKDNISDALADGSSVSGPDCQGRQNTQYLINCAVNTPAADACFNYAPTNSGFAAAGNWFLPSLGEWNLMAKGLTGKSTGFSTSSNSSPEASAVNAKITAAGGTGLQSDLYWSSTEYSATNAWRVFFGLGLVNCNLKYSSFYVRAALAF